MKKLLNLLLIVAMLLSLAGCGNKNYKEGMEAFENKNYLKAIELLTEAGDYKDAFDIIKQCRKLQLEKYLEYAEFNGIVKLYQSCDKDELAEVEDKIFDMIGYHLEYVCYRFGGATDITNTCLTAQKAADMLISLGYEETNPKVSTLLALANGLDHYNEYKTIIEMYVEYQYKIRDCLDHLNGLSNISDVKKAGNNLIALANEICDKYPEDEKIAEFAKKYKAIGDTVLKVANVTTASEASKMKAELTAKLLEFVASTAEIVAAGAVTDDLLEAVNQEYNTGLGYIH